MASRYANKGIDNTVITEPNTVITVPNKGNEIKGNEIKGNEKDIPPNPPKPSNKATKVQYAEFVTMTEKEYTTLVEKHGEGKTREIIEILDNYKGSKGETYKSDYRAILSWVIKRWDEDNDRKGKADGKNQNAKKLAEQYNLGF
jgi:hypothetical protein